MSGGMPWLCRRDGQFAGRTRARSTGGGIQDFLWKQNWAGLVERFSNVRKVWGDTGEDVISPWTGSELID